LFVENKGREYEIKESEGKCFMTFVGIKNLCVFDLESMREFMLGAKGMFSSNKF
jgi:hypothetical protein